jgi:hypothetical protein
MSDTYERRKERQGHQDRHPRVEKGAEGEPEPTTFDEAESIRSGSQTAQDRDHTIRGGDDRTGPMKEFPT